jgi:hypothetical protein
MMQRLILATLTVFLTAALAPAAEVLPPASERFAAATGQEIPDFQRHVVPLLGRLGCNGRACHGSFQGQGGFRLSLFGYDFEADHKAVSERVVRGEPEKSLLLVKPTNQIDHDGGKRYATGGWEYNLLLRWIKGDIPAAGTEATAFETLEVEPREIVFAKRGQTVQLKVVARWADGSREDVTCLCRFRSNNDSAAAVDAAGLVTSLMPGDTHVVAFYDNGIASVPVILPVSNQVGEHYASVPTPTKIDELVVGKLKKLGIVPSELCTDSEFLRRVSLDMTGTLPTAAETAAFLADKSADKRAQKIDELLARPTYAAWWTTRLCDLTGNTERTGPLGGEQALNREKARQWYEWLERRVAENMPYDQIVERMVLAVGRRPDQTYDEYCAEMSSYFRKESPADFAARETMPYFWTRRQLGSPNAKALALAYSFLGVSLQCAECHKHPFDQWTKQDFDQFSAFFSGVKFTDGSRTRSRELLAAAELTGDQDSGAFKRKFVELVQSGAVLPFKELSVPAAKRNAKNPRAAAKGKGRVITPKLLGGEEVISDNYDDPRRPLLDWMRDPENPYFAKALVNRVWAGYFNVGIIDPPDDLNLANPPSNSELLDYLAEEFVKHEYDLKWLHREIASSRTYQLSWRPNETNRRDERNYSRAVVRRLPAEVAYDALVFATASDELQARLLEEPVRTRAIGVSSGFADGRDGANYAVNLFGKPPRSINCDCERSSEPSLMQTVYLRNDDEVQKLIDRTDGWVKQIQKSKRTDADELAREAFLRTLARLPDERESAVAKQTLSDAENVPAGIRELLWALLNTKEFILNH